MSKNLAATGQIDPEDVWQTFQEQLAALGVEEYLAIYPAAYHRLDG